MTSAEQSVETTFVIGLHDPAGPGPEVAGTKAATLAYLASRGFRVPEGFVVTTAACDRIRATVGIPREVWAEVLPRLDQLGNDPLAVRSSGLAEDLAEASYAGQYDTVLGVEGPEAVAERIGRCLASATSDQVRAYRGSDARSQMAVLVQRMVPAEAAGVAFTANPVSGDTEVLVSAVKGPGDRLVSGEATPDEWVVRGPRCRASVRPGVPWTRSRYGEIAELAKAVERPLRFTPGHRVGPRRRRGVRPAGPSDHRPSGRSPPRGAVGGLLAEGHLPLPDAAYAIRSVGVPAGALGGHGPPGRGVRPDVRPRRPAFLRRRGVHARHPLRWQGTSHSAAVGHLAGGAARPPAAPPGPCGTGGYRLGLARAAPRQLGGRVACSLCQRVPRAQERRSGDPR